MCLNQFFSASFLSLTAFTFVYQITLKAVAGTVRERLVRCHTHLSTSPQYVEKRVKIIMFRDGLTPIFIQDCFPNTRPHVDLVNCSQGFKCEIFASMLYLSILCKLLNTSL